MDATIFLSLLELYFVIQIIHNGSSSDKFKIEGKMKGVKEIAEGDSARYAQRQIKVAGQIFPKIDDLIWSPLFMKYFGTFVFGGVGVYSIWHLFHGKTDWYVWLGAVLGLLFSSVIYFGHKHLPPVKI